METISSYMAKDHDRLDELFKQFQNFKKQDIVKAKQFFHDFKIGLQRHIVWEEEILFPVFETATGMTETGPTAVMRMEHREIKGFLEKIHEHVSKTNPDSDEFETGMLNVLKPHNDKEESMLYQWIDDAVDDDKRKSMFEEMHNLPEEKYKHCCENH